MRFSRALLILCCLVTLPAAETQAAPKNIYDTAADGQKLVAAALQKAKRENRHVLLQFGANWCPECHRLHDVFANNAAIRAKLASTFVVVLLDVNADHNADLNRQYGSPTLRGLPVLVILDPDGNQIFTKDTSEFFTRKETDSAKVFAFLNKW